ncbi:hypothetical protein Kpol_1008p18 [Vanderwaltozyma polyspora DSM 70294]|uniref:Phosphoadenosine phosphosulphate reductase domain-containing protein n=1 Tax=Vanderwaltozyma polyspora (strain ATCC 22028 / DSM 70294 / BCRC 21397 / CBS 2163 / NBRC 10782 / NRRL Y-8283 / UCD 57-17) TaxID=436907 RepID=A7TPY2_VANPO|nr:uncharacterized protein Kpol_1008p18 [Vanderwaltozyma polyspora DSM 70294]EDO15680.1 hypothetical protein Kpol_1008p18 [Vanderwaltozyma polyspora DSM 70294]
MTTDNCDAYELNNGMVVNQRQIDHWNRALKELESPLEILKWALVTFPGLFQTTAFGLTGLAITDMLSSLTKYNGNKMVGLIFIDTLYHFPQTLDLVQKVEDKYYAKYGQSVNIFKPKDCETSQDFVKKHGDFLWEADDEKYDFLVKVEPAHRAYEELHVAVVLTGRRRSQGGSRSSLPYIEIDKINKVLKINPLVNWDFNDIKKYIDDNNVPYNELVDLGYRSIGDYHSTAPVQAGEDERSGRWKGKAKTECGIHETSKFTKFLDQNSRTL